MFDPPSLQTSSRLGSSSSKTAPSTQKSEPLSASLVGRLKALCQRYVSTQRIAGQAAVRSLMENDASNDGGRELGISYVFYLNKTNIGHHSEFGFG